MKISSLRGLLIVLLLVSWVTPLIAQTSPTSTAANVGADGFNLEDLPTVVATVNGVRITKAELLSEAQGAFRQLAALGDVRELNEAFYAEALDQLIAGILLHEEATALGFAASDEELDAEIAKAKAAYDSEEAFLRGLAQQGVSEANLRTDLARQNSIQKIINVVVRPTVTVSEEAARAFYEQNLEKMDQPERVRVRHLMAEKPTEATEAETATARARAEAWLERLGQGVEFGALAGESDDQGTRETGGEIPWLTRGQTLPEFDESIFALQQGERSEVVETDLGFHIIESLERISAHTATFESVRESIERALVQQNLPAAVLRRVEQLTASADIERALP